MPKTLKDGLSQTKIRLSQFGMSLNLTGVPDESQTEGKYSGINEFIYLPRRGKGGSFWYKGHRLTVEHLQESQPHHRGPPDYSHSSGEVTSLARIEGIVAATKRIIAPSRSTG